MKHRKGGLYKIQYRPWWFPWRWLDVQALWTDVGDAKIELARLRGTREETGDWETLNV